MSANDAVFLIYSDSTDYTALLSPLLLPLVLLEKGDMFDKTHLVDLGGGLTSDAIW